MMNFGEVLIVFSIILITRDANGRISLKDLIAPENPIVNRVRRMEEAHGDPLAVLDTVGLVEKHGYPAEQHSVTTKDGYNIEFFRIPGSPKSKPMTGKPIVFLQHGLTASSDCWVLMGPKNDLAFLLADSGYDVWIGNVRGNSYARSHNNLTPQDKEFWNFSFDEIGSIDTLSLIDYALEYTGQEKFFFIGHSMGPLLAYIVLMERPEYNDKTRLVVSLAPGACWKYESAPLVRMLAQNTPFIKILADTLGIYYAFPQSRTTAEIIRMACAEDSPMRNICVYLYQLIDGQHVQGFNNTAIPTLLQYLPAGVSLRSAFHFFQSINTAAASHRKYDFGTTKNLKIYGTKQPPLYNLSTISAPVALFYGQTDNIVVAPNVIGLTTQFSNLVTCEAVRSPVFSHLDFIWSPHAKDILYPRIMELLSKY